MRKLSTALNLGTLGLQCAYNAYNMWQGGNQWSAWVSFLAFFRHVSRLPLDYSKWDHYEQLTRHSGPRIMHEKFCIISDRPRTLKVNAQNRPHCDDGPFCLWSDGAALYSIHGVRVPAWVVETPAEQIDPKAILQEKNAEVRRELVRKIGIARVVKELGAKTLDSLEEYRLLEIDYTGSKRIYLQMKNPSIDAIHVEAVHPGCETVKAALAWRNGDDKFIQPEVLT